MTSNTTGTTPEVLIRLVSMLETCAEYFNDYTGTIIFTTQEQFDKTFGVGLEFITHFEKCYDMAIELKRRYDEESNVTDNESIATTYIPNFTLVPSESESSVR